MNYELLAEFCIFTIINVIIQTAKSLITYKGNKLTASLANAVAYGLYTYIIVLTMCDLPMGLKAGVTAVCNFIGVYVVKYIEEKMEKEKLWKVELTVCADSTELFHNALEAFGVAHNYVPNIGRWTLFNCYCATCKESEFVKTVAEKYNAKYFVSESKTL